MKVYINNKEIDIFRGATILDAVRKYSPHSCRRVMNETLMVIDRFGNRTEPDGEPTEGQHFQLKMNK
ncbi:MAG: hypothetical protein WCO93_04850 [bacterium]